MPKPWRGRSFHLSSATMNETRVSPKEFLLKNTTKKKRKKREIYKDGSIPQRIN
jgi:hypothetical protein